jgi:hypothetical protein
LWLDERAERRDMLAQIRETMSPGERSRLNTPQAAYLRVKAAIEALDTSEKPKPERETVKQALAASIARESELKREIEQIKQGEQWRSNERPEVIAKAFVDELLRHAAETKKANKVGAILLHVIKLIEARLLKKKNIDAIIKALEDKRDELDSGSEAVADRPADVV